MRHGIKRILVVAVLMLGLFTGTVFAYTVTGLNNFEKTRAYEKNVFTDVASTKWYAKNVEEVYEYELMNGKGNSKFAPEANITIAETVAVMASMNYIYHTGELLTFDLSYGEYSSWYEPYVEYAKSQGILEETYSNYMAAATRAQFVQILSAAVSPGDLEEINWVDDGAIPDVSMDAAYAEDVYLFYRAGILTGAGGGVFKTNANITRAEAAAVVTRMIDPTLRQSIELYGGY